MTTKLHSATGSVTVRLSVELISKLDALCQATERTRSYWLAEAVAEVIERELWQVREVEEALAEDDADPDGGLPNDDLAAWMIAHGLTTRDALDRAAATSGRAHG